MRSLSDGKKKICRRNLRSCGRCLAVLAAAMLLALPLVAVAQERNDGEQIYREQLEASGAEDLPQQLPEETRELLQELGLADFSEDGIFRLNFENVLQQTAVLARQKASDPLRAALCVVGIIALCALLQSVKTSFLNDEITQVFSVVCVLMTASVMVTPLVSLISGARDTALAAFAFLISFVPVYAGIMVANGQAVTAGAYSATTVAAAQGASGLLSAVVTPVLQMLLALAIVSAAAPRTNLQGIHSFLQKMVKWLLGIVMTVFVTVLSLQGAAGAAADSLTVRTAKFVIGSAVPVVGGALSDAYTSVRGYVGVLKSSVGAFGILAGGAIFLPLTVELMIWIAAAELCAAVGGLLDQKEIAGLLKAISAVLGLFLAVLLCCAALLIISTGIVLAARTS
ncbi:MAG: stage III sporulation protein AE [Firmicutes bacterium]|nr:stage III sporulation protein AE [Bacillota bacterium]